MLQIFWLPLHSLLFLLFLLEIHVELSELHLTSYVKTNEAHWLNEPRETPGGHIQSERAETNSWKCSLERIVELQERKKNSTHSNTPLFALKEKYEDISLKVKLVRLPSINQLLHPTDNAEKKSYKPVVCCNLSSFAVWTLSLIACYLSLQNVVLHHTNIQTVALWDYSSFSHIISVRP